MTHPLQIALQQSERAAARAARLRAAARSGQARAVIRENAAAARKTYQDWLDAQRPRSDGDQGLAAPAGSP
ncbi:MAG: hypothetical protein IPM64_17805 [Phycisphaerales bacterium]|nr:hypothetical protein [Phycisphaerales bacterium]